MSAPAEDLACPQLLELLRQRYGQQGMEYVVLTEVGNGPGFSADRFCDLLAIGLWPSKGLEWQGHEVKASRGDWLRERQDPDKADAFARFCDRWWIVAPSTKVVRPEELRPGWGLLVPGTSRGRTRLRPVVGAVKQKPEALSRKLVASLARKLLASSPGETERKRMEETIQALRARAETAEVRREDKGPALELERLRKDLATFEERSGIRIDGYSGWRVGDAVRQLEGYLSDEHALVRLHRVISQISDLLDAATRSRDALQEVQALAAGRPVGRTATALRSLSQAQAVLLTEHHVQNGVVLAESQAANQALRHVESAMVALGGEDALQPGRQAWERESGRQENLLERLEGNGHE